MLWCFLPFRSKFRSTDPPGSFVSLRCFVLFSQQVPSAGFYIALSRRSCYVAPRESGWCFLHALPGLHFNAPPACTSIGG